MKVYLLPMLLAEGTHDKALTPDAIGVIKALKIFFVENVKTTRRFLSSLKVGIVIDHLQFIEVTKDTTFEQVFMALSNIREDVGVLSEAGCAGVADPGALVVEAAYQLNLEVCPLVGPNSILLALMGSGMNGQSFAFHGYLPIKEQDRAAKLKQLEKEAISKQQTQIFMETPYRNNALLETILKIVNPQTRLCIACDLTADSQFIRTMTVAKWRKTSLPNLHKRPAVFLML